MYNCISRLQKNVITFKIQLKTWHAVKSISIRREKNGSGVVLEEDCCLSVCRRQREVEQKMVEEEAAKRIEELVQKRVEEELEKRKEEIEAEVQRRVEEAKRAMERQMMEEMEWRQAKLREEEKRREVRSIQRNIGQ